jgi:large subunit ribosomal protein L4
MQVPVYNISGEVVKQTDILDDVFAVPFNEAVVHQAMLRQQANARQGNASTKARSEIIGSGRKLFRQKGTGNARAGDVKSQLRRGGGVAFGPRPRDFSQAMPRKMRRLACNQAVLAKIRSEDALIVDGLKFEEPKTKHFAAVLQAVNCERGCVFATNGVDRTLYKSARNIPRAEIMDVAQLNAFDILSRRKLVFTRDAFETFRHGTAAAVKAGE